MPGFEVLDWYTGCIVMCICITVIVAMRNMICRGNCNTFGKVNRCLLRRDNSSTTEWH